MKPWKYLKYFFFFKVKKLKLDQELQPTYSPSFYGVKYVYFKVIVSRDIGGLQMILMDKIGVPDIPLDVYLFLIFVFI